jgi:hypothetical protein
MNGKKPFGDCDSIHLNVLFVHGLFPLLPRSCSPQAKAPRETDRLKYPRESYPLTQRVSGARPSATFHGCLCLASASKPVEPQKLALLAPIAKQSEFTPAERKPEQAAAQRIEVESVVNESVLIPDMKYQCSFPDFMVLPTKAEELHS